MIIKGKDIRTVVAAPGVVRKTIVVGERMLMVQFSISAGSVVTLHSHPHEQVGYVVSGSQRLTVGDETHLIEAGDSYFIPPGVPHGSEAIADSVAVDVFSPPREDYMA